MKFLLLAARAITWCFALYALWFCVALFADTSRHDYGSLPVGRRFEIAWPLFAIGFFLVFPNWKIRRKWLRIGLLVLFMLASLTAVLWSVAGVLEVLTAEDTPSTIPLALLVILAVTGNVWFVLKKKAPNHPSEPLSPSRGGSS